jgi:hypothetical protein
MKNKSLKTKKENNFDWKLVGYALFGIVVIYFIISYAIAQSKSVDRVTAYCMFNATINDDVPRDQCGYLKIITKDINQVNIHDFERFGWCKENFEDLPDCEGDSYNFGRYELKTFCEDENCDTDGIICAAYYISYHDESLSRQYLKETLFQEADLKSEEVMLEKFRECKI